MAVNLFLRVFKPLCLFIFAGVALFLFTDNSYALDFCTKSSVTAPANKTYLPSGQSCGDGWTDQGYRECSWDCDGFSYKVHKNSADSYCFDNQIEPWGAIYTGCIKSSAYESLWNTTTNWERDKCEVEANNVCNLESATTYRVKSGSCVESEVFSRYACDGTSRVKYNKYECNNEEIPTSVSDPCPSGQVCTGDGTCVNPTSAPTPDPGLPACTSSTSGVNKVCGDCTAPANSCSPNNGTKTCQWVKDGFCNPASAGTEACFKDTCPSTAPCSGGVCTPGASPPSAAPSPPPDCNAFDAGGVATNCFSTPSTSYPDGQAGVCTGSYPNACGLDNGTYYKCTYRARDDGKICNPKTVYNQVKCEPNCADGYMCDQTASPKPLCTERACTFNPESVNPQPATERGLLGELIYIISGYFGGVGQTRNLVVNSTPAGLTMLQPTLTRRSYDQRTEDSTIPTPSIFRSSGLANSYAIHLPDNQNTDKDYYFQLADSVADRSGTAVAQCPGILLKVPAAGGACPVKIPGTELNLDSTQVRFRHSAGEAWRGTPINGATVTQGSSIDFAVFYNGYTDDAHKSNDAVITAVGPDSVVFGLQDSPNQNPVSHRFNSIGRYTIRAQMRGKTGDKCVGELTLDVLPEPTAVPTATPSPPPGCSNLRPKGISSSGWSDGKRLYIANPSADGRGQNWELEADKTHTARALASPTVTGSAGAATATFGQLENGNAWIRIPDNSSPTADVEYIVSGKLDDNTTACGSFVIRVVKNDACPSDITSTQARIRIDSDPNWYTERGTERDPVIIGSTVRVAGYINGTLEASGYEFVYTDLVPLGSGAPFARVISDPNNYPVNEPGTHTITARVKDRRGDTCVGRATLTMSAVPTATPSPTLSPTPTPSLTPTPTPLPACRNFKPRGMNDSGPFGSAALPLYALDSSLGSWVPVEVTKSDSASSIDVAPPSASPSTGRIPARQRAFDDWNVWVPANTGGSDKYYTITTTLDNPSKTPCGSFVLKVPVPTSCPSGLAVRPGVKVPGDDRWYINYQSAAVGSEIQVAGFLTDGEQPASTIGNFILKDRPPARPDGSQPTDRLISDIGYQSAYRLTDPGVHVLSARLKSVPSCAGTMNLEVLAPSPTPTAVPTATPTPTPITYIVAEPDPAVTGGSLSVRWNAWSLGPSGGVGLYQVAQPPKEDNLQSDWFYAATCTRLLPTPGPDGLTRPVTSGVCSLPVPSQPRRYEFRLFERAQHENRLATSNQIDVTTPTPTPIPTCDEFNPEGLSPTDELTPGGLVYAAHAEHQGKWKKLRVSYSPSYLSVNRPVQFGKSFASSPDLEFERDPVDANQWFVKIPTNDNTTNDYHYNIGGSLSPSGTACPGFVLRIPKKPVDRTCPFTGSAGTQARMKITDSDAWGTEKTITKGEHVLVAAFHNNRTTEFPNDTLLSVVGPEGTDSETMDLNNLSNTDTGDDNNVTFTPPRAGKYTITAKRKDKEGEGCLGTAVLTVQEPPAITEFYQISERDGGWDSVPRRIYNNSNHQEPIADSYTFADNKPGPKFVFVRFLGRRGETRFDRVERRKITLLSPDPVINSVSCRFSPSGIGTEIEIRGRNFGRHAEQGGGSVKVAGVEATILDWQDDIPPLPPLPSPTPGLAVILTGTIMPSPTPSPTVPPAPTPTPEGGVESKSSRIVVKVPTKLSGRAPVNLKLDDERETAGYCLLNTTSVQVSARPQCMPVTSSIVDKVSVVLSEATAGARPLYKDMIKLDPRGVSSDWTPSIEQGKKYKLLIKAPKALAKRIDFIADEGMTALPLLTLPVGDIAPLGSPDGKVNALDRSELIREWIISKDVSREGDFNLDGRINVLDWACMRNNIGRSDDE